MHSVRRKYIRVFQGEEWRKTGLCPGTHSLCHLLCCPPLTCLDGNEDGICLRTRFDRSLSNLKRLKPKRQTIEVLIRELIFADDASKATHSDIELQRLVDRLEEACDLFGLTISVKKTEVIG